MPQELTVKSVERIIREAKASGTRIDARDGGCKGLELRASPTSATWRLYFNDRRTNRKERFVLGHFPAMSLAEARDLASVERSRVRNPKVLANPQKERREGWGSVGRNFQEIAEDRLRAGGRDTLNAKTRKHYEWCLQKYVYPVMGTVAVADVTPEGVAFIIGGIAKRGRLVTADKVRIAISSVYQWAMGEMIVKSNPAAGVRRQSSSLGRERVLTDDELRAVLQAVTESKLYLDLDAILRLLVLTGQRSTEVRVVDPTELRWEGVEVHGVRFPHPCWVIPGRILLRGLEVGGRTKSGREQILPLSTQAAKWFRYVQSAVEEEEVVPPKGRLFWTPDHHAVARAMSRTCARAGVEGATAHDLRRTCATWLGGRGVRPDVLESILNHAPQGVTKQVYDRSRLLGPMLEAMQMWGDHVESLTPLDPPS